MVVLRLPGSVTCFGLVVDWAKWLKSLLVKLDLAKYVKKICIGHRILLPRVIPPSATYCNLKRIVFDNMLGKQLHSCLRDHTELETNFEVALKIKWESHALMLQLLLAEHNEQVIMSYGDC